MGGRADYRFLADTYKVPTFESMPDEFESDFIEDGDGQGPYGAKGLGEGGIIPVAPAVLRILVHQPRVPLPLTPEKV